MNIEIIEPCGYSKTLSNLLEVANKARYCFPNSKIVLLGNILNGEQVKNELLKLNILIIDIPYEGFEDYIKTIDENTVVITSPYGTEEKFFKILKKRKIVYFDATSPSTLNKLDLIKKAKFYQKIIFVGNLNTIEENFLANSTNHKFYFYDMNNESVNNNLVFSKKFNKKSTQIIYQSELANYNLSLALHKLKNYLPEAQINHTISDENFEKKKTLLDKIKNDDVLLIVSSNKKSDKYIVEYYHLNTVHVYYATISSVQEAINLNIRKDRKIYLISDGSVSREKIDEIYNYFKYKDIQGELLDQQSKPAIQNL